jgi:hypothetical protein
MLNDKNSYRIDFTIIFLENWFYIRKQKPCRKKLLSDKLHKTPYKERYIAGSSTCSTKELSIHLTKILSAVKLVVSDIYSFLAYLSEEEFQAFNEL